MNFKKEKITYRDGSVYIGNTKNGHRYGYGILTFSNGSKYEGEWNKSDFHGLYISADGKKTKQYWVDGKKISEEIINTTNIADDLSSPVYTNNITYDSELLITLKKIINLYGMNCFYNGNIVKNLIADLLPGNTHAKRRRRVKVVIDLGACEMLIKKSYTLENRINSAKSILMDYSDMNEDIAYELINTFARAFYD